MAQTPSQASTWPSQSRSESTVPRESTSGFAPTGTEHTPATPPPDPSQTWQRPAQPWSQHTPSTHSFVPHCTSSTQGVPFASLGTQAPAAQ